MDTKDIADITDNIQEKAQWYIKYRTTIWGAVWFLVGMFGGNADRIKEYTTTPSVDSADIQKINVRLDRLENEIFRAYKNEK